MKRTTLSARFYAGFEPITLPPRGPDGMIPSGPAKSLPVIDPPTLCEAGPCRNYHRVCSVMDAEDGGHGGPLRTQISRACYPTPGVEIELGETPVLQCSRWEPDSEQARLDGIRSQFLKNTEGKAFTERMNAFEEANEAARKAEEDTEHAVLSHVPTGTPSDADLDALEETLDGDKPDPKGQAEADAAVARLVVAEEPALKVDDLPSSGFDVSDEALDALEAEDSEDEVTP